MTEMATEIPLPPATISILLQPVLSGDGFPEVYGPSTRIGSRTDLFLSIVLLAAA